MKGTDHFKKTIQDYLEDRAGKDELFAKSFSKPNKNINDCITHILNTVKNSGCVGFADDEIYGMAVHYYDEDNITIGRPISGDVIVNHKIEISEEEKDEARKKAKKEFEEKQLRDLQQAEERKAAKAKQQEKRKRQAELRKEIKREQQLKKMEPTLF